MTKHTICVRVSAHCIVGMQKFGKWILHILCLRTTLMILLWLLMSLSTTAVIHDDFKANEKPLNLLQMILTDHVSSYWLTDFECMLIAVGLFIILVAGCELLAPKVHRMWKSYCVNVHDELIQLKRR